MKKLITEVDRVQLFISDDNQIQEGQDDITLIISLAKPRIGEDHPHSIKLTKRQVKKLINELTELL